MAYRLRHLDVLVLLSASVVLWWRPLAATFRLAFTSEAHTHILLVLPLSGALIYLERKALQTTGQLSIGLGSVSLALALLIAVYAEWGTSGVPADVRLSLSMFALVIWWIASFLLFFGRRAFRSFLFPLCFLFWVVPIPESALNGVVLFLQHESAFAAQILFRAAGVPVTQDDVMLSIPGLDIEVARECSSIRSSLMLVITTMVLAHLLLRSWWRKSLLVAAAIPLSFVKNGLRIFVISELGTRVDPGYLDGRLHHQGGIVFFSVALGAVVALLWALRRTEATDPQKLGLSETAESVLLKRD